MLGGSQRIRVRLRGYDHALVDVAVDDIVKTVRRGFDAQNRQVNARFGEFTASRLPRQMQFALRFFF